MHPQWAELDRRHLIKLGTVGLAALSLPGAAAAMMAQGFTHGVASGEPGPNSVLLWTRYAAAGDTRLTVELSDSADFAKTKGGGSVTAMAAHDFTAKLVVDNLMPDRWYYYRFVAPDGSLSAVGRTRTLPQGATSNFTLALFSCANLPFGWFNAYGHAAARNDIDLVVQVGDYLYEYKVGEYPSARDALPGRDIQPTNELIALADYRLRYACYRSDPDLARLHQLFPMVAQWDDHEFANDAWSHGAENHNAGEGPWPARVAAAEQAYREWLPVSDDRRRHYQIGNLATILMPETRITARDQQFDLDAIAATGSDPATTLTRFRETAYVDPSRQLMGTDQEQWLATTMRSSVTSGTRWQICAQQIVMGSLFTPPAAKDWFGPNLPEPILRRVQTAQMAAKAGLPLNMDGWDGYPAARERFLSAAQAADADLVVLSGDSHNAWAFDLEQDKRPTGIEIGGHSVTSPGFEAYTPGVADPARVSALRASSPQLQWANTEKRGYVSVTLSTDKVTANWHMMDTIRAKSLAADTHSMTVQRGRRKYDGA